MQSELLKMAEGFSLVASALTAIAKDSDSGSKGQRTVEKVQEPVKAKSKAQAGDSSEPKKYNNSQVTIEDIRAVLAEKSQDGKSKEVKTLLNQYGVAMLSAVAEKDYPGLLQKAKAL